MPKARRPYPLEYRQRIIELARGGRSMGAVTGNVTAGDKLEIQTTGSVTGDIISPRLVIVDGGHLHGQVQMPQSEGRRPLKS